MAQNRSTAVMAQRKEAPASLDYFPTPPWAVRAFCAAFFAGYPDRLLGSVWDPACGEGHMLAGLADRFPICFGSDVYDYGKGYPVGDFCDATPLNFWQPGEKVDWIITNPPFNQAADFMRRALALRPRGGVALLMRSVWLEGGARWREIFNTIDRPDEVWISAERIAMLKGRYDPAASTATSYAWFIWHSPHEVAGPRPAGQSRLCWVPPGGKDFQLEADALIGRWRQGMDEPGHDAQEAGLS